LIFFFQAEDGIRDRNVTGVQTCALPISLVGDQRKDPVAPRLLVQPFQLDTMRQREPRALLFDVPRLLPRAAPMLLAVLLRGQFPDLDRDPGRDVTLTQDRLGSLGDLRPGTVSRPRRGELLTQLAQSLHRPLDPLQPPRRVQLGLALAVVPDQPVALG